jgi:putative DNA primase/helicase
LAAKLARFSADYRGQVREARPHLPEQLNDRAQDNWEPLLSIASVAGSDWLQKATVAALKLSGSEMDAMSIGVELLADIQEIFDTDKVDKIFTSRLIEALCEDDERPWATYNRGKPISPRQVSNRLHGYGIKSKTVRVKWETKKGFEKDQFIESFNRYLAEPKKIFSDSPVLSVTTSQATNDKAYSVTDSKHASVTNVFYPSHVTKSDIEKCDVVTDRTPLLAKNNLLDDDVEYF